MKTIKKKLNDQKKKFLGFFKSYCNELEKVKK